MPQTGSRSVVCALVIFGSHSSALPMEGWWEEFWPCGEAEKQGLILCRLGRTAVVCFE